MRASCLHLNATTAVVVAPSRTVLFVLVLPVAQEVSLHLLVGR